MKFGKKAGLFLVLFFLFAAPSVFAQSGFSLSGVVRDDIGAPVAGLFVNLERTYNNGLFSDIASTITDTNGNYVISGPELSTGTDYHYTLYVSGRRKPCGPSSPANYTYTSLSSVYTNQDFTALPGVPLNLSWAGETGYESDGVSPDTVAAGEAVVFKVKCRADIGSWQIKKIMLHVRKDSVEISGSPFEMSLDRITNYGPWFEAIYKQQTVFQSAGNYTYYFEGIDVIGDIGAGTPTDALPFVVSPGNLVKIEADYILQCQYIQQIDPANGCINNVYGAPTWVVPRENAMAILGLIMASEILNEPAYKDRAQLAADYLIRIQQQDGAWADQYNYAVPVIMSKSPTQAAEVMIAFYKLGYRVERYEAMKKGAQYLMACQNVNNKSGNDDGLVAGGKDESGNYRAWRWASDNAYAYQALKAAQSWAINKGDTVFRDACAAASARIIQGINNYLYIDEPENPDYGVWYKVIDQSGFPIEPQLHEWINYAPQMLDVPCIGVNTAAVSEWIHAKLQKDDGALVWNDGGQVNRKSPGYSFQAILCWLDLQQNIYAQNALNWASASGLWQTTPDYNNVIGGWIDWKEGNETVDWWQRFIDTSFYAISAYNGGYNFNIVPNQNPVLNPIGDKEADEGQRLEFTISATDPDGDILQYFAADLPQGAEFNGQTFSWTPDYSQSGSYSVTFTVRDFDQNGIPRGGSDSQTITILVSNVDVTAPTVPGTPVLSTGTNPNKSGTYTISWAASRDTESGLRGYHVRRNGVKIAEVTRNSYSETNLAQGSYSYSIVAVDNIGNMSASSPLSAAIIVDKTAPKGSILVNNNAAYTNSTQVSLKLSATDTGGSGIYQMNFSNDKIHWTAPELFAETKNWTLTSASGTKTVYVKFWDKANNVSAVYSDKIILDTVMPSVTNISDKPDPFDPEARRRLTITYTLNDNLSPTLYVEVDIYDNAGTLVRTLGKINQYPGTRTLTWDGKNSSGAYVSNGIYRYRIKAQDKAANVVYSTYYYTTKQ